MSRLVYCPDCSKALSPTARTCPQCGCVLAEQREQLYLALVNIRNTELAAFWTRYNIQAVLNTGMIAVGLAALKGPDRLPVAVLLAISVGGATLAVFWLLFAILGKPLFVEGWEEWIAEYEENWLQPHYGKGGQQAAPSGRGPLLFFGFKERAARSPIHPNPVGKRLNHPKVAGVKPFLRDWIEPSNLNLLTAGLPILFAVAWLSYAWYVLRFLSVVAAGGIFWIWIR